MTPEGGGHKRRQPVVGLVVDFAPRRENVDEVGEGATGCLDEHRRLPHVVPLVDGRDTAPSLHADAEREILRVVVVPLALGNHELAVHARQNHPLHSLEGLVLDEAGLNARVVEPVGELEGGHGAHVERVLHRHAVELVVVVLLILHALVPVHHLAALLQDRVLELHVVLVPRAEGVLLQPILDLLRLHLRGEVHRDLHLEVVQHRRVQQLPLLKKLVDRLGHLVRVDLEWDHTDHGAVLQHVCLDIAHDLDERRRRKDDLLLVRVLRQKGDVRSPVDRPNLDPEQRRVALARVLHGDLLVRGGAHHRELQPSSDALFVFPEKLLWQLQVLEPPPHLSVRREDHVLRQLDDPRDYQEDGRDVLVPLEGLDLVARKVSQNGIEFLKHGS
mmetsp:Transcript_184/g.504  ORF Transcript_184/g.504 Transcript_184/m.504 type:complete len:388 (+) Transcript_184:1424-2587(+)